MTGSGGGPVRVGLLRIGSALVALPVDVLREVVPLPDRFDALPASAPGLVGAVLLRESVLPVLDLGALTGASRTREAMGVVVLVHDGRSLGLLVDGVHDVVDLDAAGLQVLAEDTGERRRLFSATFARPGTGEVGSLLDPGAVVAFPGVLAAAAGAPPAGGAAPGATAPALDPAYLVVRCTSADGSAVLLGVDVADVQTTLPALTPGPSPLSSELCLGVTDHGDVRLPVVDPLRLLGLVPAAGAGPWQALLVRSGRGLLALVFEEALDIVRPAPAALLPPPPGTGRARGALRALARLPHGHTHVLDVAALLADPELSALTALNTSTRTAGVDATAARPRVLGQAAAAVTRLDPVVVFRSRGALTTPLAQVDGVVPFPADPAPWIGGRAGLGSLVTEHDVVPLVDLAAHLGRGALGEPAAGVVLLVRVPSDDPDAGPQRVGLVVERLDDIERPVWRENLAEAAAEERSPLVRVGSEAGPLLPCVDLVAVALSVLAPHRVPRAPSPRDGASAALDRVG